MGNLMWCRRLGVLVLLMGVCRVGLGGPKDAGTGKYTKAAAERMISAAEGTLSPVYAPLAQEIAKTLDLQDKEGIGIDLGSGPGTLIVELCKRTKLHWINADINPYFFPYFMQKAEAAGFGGRVSAIQADAQTLPFRSEYADVVVSRGSFQFWPDKRKAFGDIYRVLKPGGVAYIGRGLPGIMPIEVAAELRRKHGSGPKYEVVETAKELDAIMKALGIANYRVRRPHAGNEAGVNYGLWLEFHKPAR